MQMRFGRGARGRAPPARHRVASTHTDTSRRRRSRRAGPGSDRARLVSGRAGRSGNRSEEHTSELQSLTNLVCRLLLEKKKKNDNKHRLISHKKQTTL